MFKIWLSLALMAFGIHAEAMQQSPLLDVRSIPIADWIEAGEKTEIPWKFDVRKPALRMDQRIEVVYSGTMSGKNLQQSGPQHELFFINRISDAEGEWLTSFSIARQNFDKELPKTGEVRFGMRLLVTPGDYIIWSVLYDRKTGRHNLAKRRIEVEEIGNDPLPLAFMSLPLVEYPQIVEVEDEQFEQVLAELNLPVENKRPLDVRIISTLSPPEQWTTRARFVQRHSENLKGALDTFSQIELSDGAISMTGLDLLRREIVFEQKNLTQLDWVKLREGFQKAGSSAISATALQGKKENGAFFRDYLDQQLSMPVSPDDPLRVFIVVTSSLLFESGSNMMPLQTVGDCHCRIFHVRFRLSMYDVFDQLENLMKPLHPRKFNVLTAADLRKALAQIIAEMETL